MTGKKYGYDDQSLLCDGKRFFPMMGELHYSRYPQRFWKEALCKMKAGGIDMFLPMSFGFIMKKLKTNGNGLATRICGLL